MSGSMHPTETHLRQHRREKRNKLRAKLAAAPAVDDRRITGLGSQGSLDPSRRIATYHLSSIAQARAGPELNQSALPVRFQLTRRYES
jgi:hypothetical protein